jgi:hypothetical protein
MKSNKKIALNLLSFVSDTISYLWAIISTSLKWASLLENFFARAISEFKFKIMVNLEWQ